MSGVEGPLRIAVAGGSIGGLCAGLALSGAGFDVQVYERVSGPMETRGAGIVVQGELIDLLRTHGAGALPTTHCRVRRYLSPEGGDGEVQRAPQDFTSWEAIYRTLAAAFPSDRYHRGATLTDFGNGEGAVQAHIDGHGVVEADVLVAADGAQSLTRRCFLPDLSSTCAGYVAWRGTLDEADAPPDLVRFFGDAFTFSEARSAGHILVYFIPGDGADTTAGKRRLNWVWYVGVSQAELPRILVDRDGRQHHASLPFGGTPDSAISDLRDLARRELHPMLATLVAATPQPFLQTIVDVAPARTVFGRVCLLGDAAFVVRPHTAGAAAKAAQDATTLARALKRAGRKVDAGLSSFEEMQIEFGRGLVDYGVALGRRWAACGEMGLALSVGSKRLASLERRVGARLMARNTRRLALTEEGQDLYQRAQRILAEVDEAEAALMHGHIEPQGVLRESAPSALGRAHVSPVCRDLASIHAKLAIDLVLTDRLVNLIEEGLDVVVRIGAPKDSGLVMRKLANNHRIVVGAPDYLARRGAPAVPPDLEPHTCLHYRGAGTLWRLIGPDGKVAEFRSASRLRSDSGEVAHDWALAGCGLIMKSFVDVAPDLRAGRLVRVLPEWRSEPAPVCALFQSNRQLPTRVRVFLDARAERLSRLCGEIPDMASTLPERRGSAQAESTSGPERRRAPSVRPASSAQQGR